MPSFTVSAVDTTANTLTSTGVATSGGTLGQVLTTGDRFRLRNVGGALPAATPSLAGVTDYFAIRVSDDAIKVAVTNADAMAGTAIDITGSGSGTTTIEFNLPYCVPRIAAQGTQVFSRDFNAVWNALVALYDLLTGQAQAIWSTLIVALTVTFNAAVTFAGDIKHGDRKKSISALNAAGQAGSGWTTGTGVNFQFALSTATAAIVVPVELLVGDRLKSITFAVFGNASANLTVTVDSIDTAMAGSSIGSLTVTAPAASWSTQTIDVTDTTLADGAALQIVLSASATGIRVGTIVLVYDRP